ncbi:MAG: hypothetical protein LBB40_00920, partial [Holophagales bacterium]|nr:hypothetical protein [Holophagales bacterium]
MGISRQALLEIEKGKRTSQWNVFAALLSVLREDSGANDLLIPSRVQLTLNAKAPKFLKNRETLIFQKLAGGDCSPPYQL